MPKRIFIRDGGLTASKPTPTGYTVLGSDNGTPKKQVVSTISDLAGSGNQFQYDIGQYVSSEGGVIYHRFMTGTTQNYLVVDTQDLAQNVWSNIDNITSGATSLWDGQSNTNTITTQLGALSGAAFLCAASTNNGKSDWYLPAIQELNKLWNNMLEVSQGIETAGGTQFVSGAFDNYWSSTEGSNDFAWSFTFEYGSVNYFNKDTPIYVRAIRKFTI